MFVNHEVPLLRSEEYEVNYFSPVDYGVPSYYEVVAVTSDETWEATANWLKEYDLIDELIIQLEP